MGKTRKPIDMQKAHLTLVEKQNRKMEEESVTTGNNQLKTPPKWLIDDVQRKMGFNNLRRIYKIHSNALKNIRLAKQYKM